MMGLLLGKVDGSTMVVMDSFALPVEGTETRVNAQSAAYEYMAEYIEAAKKVCVWELVSVCGLMWVGHTYMGVDNTCTDIERMY